MKYRNAISPHKGFQEKFVRSNVDVVFGGGQLGGGKMNPLYTNVLTPQGWRKMGDLSVGDLVSTPFGEPVKVLSIYEHKNKDIYEIRTKDGRKARCGLEHLWFVRSESQLARYHKDLRKDGNCKVCTTEDLIKYMADGKKMYIPIPTEQEMEEKNLPLSPYIVGFLACRGRIANKFGTEYFSANIRESDIVERFEDEGLEYVFQNPDTFEYSFDILDSYASLADMFRADGGVSIPNEYLNGSIEQRFSLLCGLMDAAGYINGREIHFKTINKNLVENIEYVCRSLGFVTEYNLNRDSDYYGGHVYNVKIYTDDFIFSSKRLVSKYKRVLKTTKKNGYTKDHVLITSIEKVDKCDARCIYIDDPLHLYIIDDFLTTHNTFASIMSVAEPSLDPKFRAVFLRNNLGDLRASGGILDDFKNCYGMGVRVVESGEPHADFPSGARIDVTHVADQSKKILEKRFKGRQYDLIYYDELTGFTWECFSFMFSRNRGKALWTGKVRATTNPKRSHWARKFLDWYIGIDGEIIEEREGVVRYFYNAGESVEEVVWGATKEEVYNKCKIQIDRFLRKFNGTRGKATYKDVIKSFTFYLGRTSENEELGGSYAGSVAAMGGRNAEENSGNWNVDTDADEDAPIPQEMANKVFTNDPMTNGDKWVTCDLADSGTDNLLMLAWDGFHVYDCKIFGHTTCRQNAEILKEFAVQNNIPDDHIIYDAIRGTYINDYIEDAVQFVSYRAPSLVFGRSAQRLKDECYLRFIEAVKRGYMSIANDVARRIYEHQNLKDKERVTFQNEFLEECAVVRFMDMPSGKKRLFSKKEMNHKLGKGRSMDVLDPIAMRFYPVREFPYGEELEKTIVIAEPNEYDELDEYDSDSIYNETLFS